MTEAIGQREVFRNIIMIYETERYFTNSFE